MSKTKIYYIPFVFLHIPGCPSPGYYGEKCNLGCPQNCKDHRCHITNGTCLGCESGYLGAKCNQGMSTFLSQYFKLSSWSIKTVIPIDPHRYVLSVFCTEPFQYF